MTPFVCAGAGFLLAVLWFDLMFDVQVLAHRGRDVPEGTIASIAGYYRRVTTAARPMNRLVALVMLGTIAAVVVELVRTSPPNWVAWASLVLVTAAVLLAAVHTFPSARRLGARSDTLSDQGRLARSICRDHLLCLVAMLSLLTIQLAFAR
jgi:hypothetical protein